MIVKLENGENISSLSKEDLWIIKNDLLIKEDVLKKELEQVKTYLVGIKEEEMRREEEKRIADYNKGIIR